MIHLSECSFNKLYYKLLELGYYQKINKTTSRIGEVKDLGRVVYQIDKDPFRLCFLKERKINPFFAYAEFSWLIEGNNLVEPLQYFIKDYNKFSDDDVTLNGAYGYRLINYFEVNQIERAIRELEKNRDSRRVVLSMYSTDDLNKTSKDIPCNTTIYLKIRNNKLDITILNRSNDLYLGVPYNVFIFYMFQVYIARKVNSELGVQTHYTDSLHLYDRNLNDVKKVLDNNSLEEIEYLEKEITSFDNSIYIDEDHKEILKKNYDDLNLCEFRDIFNLIKDIKNKKNIDYDIIPDNILGYSIYNWLKDKKDINLELDFFKEIEKGIKLTNIQLLESLKGKEKSIIIKNINKLRNELTPQFGEFKKVLEKEDGIFSLNLSNEDKILTIILLFIIRESLDEYIYAREIRQPLMEKIIEIATEFSITLEEINYFKKYEKDIRVFINS